MVSGMLKEEKGDSLAACQNYERVLTRFPDFTPARKRLAELYGNLGDDAKTYEMATKAREALPGDTEVARSLGIVLYRRGGADNFRRAAQLLDESVSKGTEDGQAFYYLGMARFQLKQRQECKTALERALALNIQPKLADDAKKILAQLN
jgi:tetratricopeptide (TPR) repeat protein